MKKLKPVVFVQGDRNFYRENKYGQNLLIKAMSEGITDVNELKKAAGLKTVAEVYRTLDKISIRKEYHEMLVKNGLDLDTITRGIQAITENVAEKTSDRLKGYNMILKSLGLDKYEKDEDGGKNWEELIMEASEKKEKNEETKLLDEGADYEVITPQTPDAEKKRQADEKEVGKQLYE